MKLILHNPFRIIGVFANANQRAIAKQKTQILALNKVGKQVQFEDELVHLGKITRTTEIIDKAFRDIEINSNKIFHSLFWFVNHNHLDEIALSYLKKGDTLKAQEVWSSLTSNGKVTSINFSAYNNLGTLSLLNLQDISGFDYEKLKSALLLKIELISSDYFNSYVNLVADETYSIDSDKEINKFTNSLIDDLKKSNNIDYTDLVSFIGECHDKLGSFITSRLSNEPIHNIETLVANTKKMRMKSPEKGFLLAKKLYANSKKDLITLKKVIGDDYKYQVTADSVAKEILQCGIDYFQEIRDNEAEHAKLSQQTANKAVYGSLPNLGEDVIRIFKISLSLATGSQLKERINENILGIEEWIEEKPFRDKLHRIKSHYELLQVELEEFQIVTNSIENVVGFVNRCRPSLINIRSILGPRDELFINLSSAVVGNAQGMLVMILNKDLDTQNKPVYLQYYGIPDHLKNKINRIYSLFRQLKSYEMDSQLRARFNKNFEVLQSIAISAGINISFSSETISSDRKDKQKRTLKHENNNERTQRENTLANILTEKEIKERKIRHWLWGIWITGAILGWILTGEIGGALFGWVLSLIPARIVVAILEK